MQAKENQLLNQIKCTFLKIFPIRFPLSDIHLLGEAYFL